MHRYLSEANLSSDLITSYVYPIVIHHKVTSRRWFVALAVIYSKNELVDTISTLNDKNTHRDWMICFAVWCYNMYTDLIKETTDTKREIQTHRKEKNDNSETKRKTTDRQTTVYKTKHRTLQTEQHGPHLVGDPICSYYKHI